MEQNQRPTVGRIVLFEPDPNDSEAQVGSLPPGNKLPALIVRVWSDTCVNLRVFTDGNAVLWRHSVSFGTGPCTWNWPPRS